LKYQQGNIVNVNLGDPPKEVQGHEQGFLRPCVVVKSFPALALVVVVPCTSKAPVYNHFTVVHLQKGTGGLSMDSFVLCHQIRTVSLKRITATLGALDPKSMYKVRAVLLDILEL